MSNCVKLTNVQLSIVSKCQLEQVSNWASVKSKCQFNQVYISSWASAHAKFELSKSKCQLGQVSSWAVQLISFQYESIAIPPNSETVRSQSLRWHRCAFQPFQMAHLATAHRNSHAGRWFRLGPVHQIAHLATAPSPLARAPLIPPWARVERFCAARLARCVSSGEASRTPKEHLETCS